MSIEFGWWAKDEDGKYQINVRIHGGNIAWTRKGGHWQSWEEYGPVTDEDWEKLLGEASRRVPRRLISPKQFDEIKALRDRSDGGKTTPKQGHQIKVPLTQNETRRPRRA